MQVCDGPATCFRIRESYDFSDNETANFVVAIRRRRLEERISTVCTHPYGCGLLVFSVSRWVLGGTCCLDERWQNRTFFYMCLNLTNEEPTNNKTGKMGDFLKDLLLKACEYAQKNPHQTARIVTGAYEIGKQACRSAQTREATQHATLKGRQPIPAGGIRASTFYMRVEKFQPSDDPALLTFRLSGDTEVGRLHCGEYVHFRAPQRPPILLQCLDDNLDRLTFKAASRADVDCIRQCVGTYFSCRICNPDYQEKF